MPKNLARRKFVDVHGVPVRVGDRVRGYRVNENHVGTVVECVTDPKLKHFRVRLDQPFGGDFPYCYFHKSWTEKITPEETTR